MNIRIFRFLLSGGSAAAAEYLSFLTLQACLGTGALLVSQSSSFACGLVVSFLLNRHWVFRSTGTWTRELARFSVLAAINLALGNIVISVLVVSAGLHPLVAKVGVMVMIAFWNYAIFSRLVFKQPPTG